MIGFGGTRIFSLARSAGFSIGVLDLSRRKLHLVRGVDRSGRNDIHR
jgi:hypothetical protein